MVEAAEGSRECLIDNDGDEVPPDLVVEIAQAGVVENWRAVGGPDRTDRHPRV